MQLKAHKGAKNSETKATGKERMKECLCVQAGPGVGVGGRDN